MKVYDKEMYNKQESIKTTVVMIIVFLIGFVAGYMANSFSSTNQNTINKNNIEITEQN